jgi:GT2 family glycosyltransferase
MSPEVIVVTYNSARDIRLCIGSILSNGAQPVVVDNGSIDATLVILASEFRHVPVYSNPHNGYARAANIGFAHTTGDVVIVSNADVVYPPGTISRLSDYCLAHDDIGVLGPQQVYPDGSWERSWGLITGLCEAMMELFGVTTLYNALRRIVWPVRINRRTIDVGYVDGAIMAIRRQAFEAVGGFDERFPFSSEETDFCVRARALGWRVASLPRVNVIHRRGGSVVCEGWAAEQHAEVLLHGTRLFLQKHHSGLYMRCYFAIKHLFNAYMSGTCSLLARIAIGSARAKLRLKAAVHRSYRRELRRLLRNSATSEDSSAVLMSRGARKAPGTAD